MLGMQTGNETFDAVLATTSPRLLADLTPALDDAYRAKLLGLKSIGAVNLILAIKQPLSTQGYYWFNLPKTAGFPFLALVEHTNFVPADLFGGDSIIYCGDYLPADHEYFRLSKEELLERFIPSFKRINPDFSPSWVRQTWLFRSAYAQPVPGLNHSQNIPSIQTPVSNLFFASMSQVYPWDRGTNYAVELARKAARQIISSVR
jgi:protoporphyrinogen oxidase